MKPLSVVALLAGALLSACGDGSGLPALLATGPEDAAAPSWPSIEDAGGDASSSMADAGGDVTPAQDGAAPDAAPLDATVMDSGRLDAAPVDGTAPLDSTVPFDATPPVDAAPTIYMALHIVFPENGSGTVTSSDGSPPCSGSCTWVVPLGSTVTITLTPGATSIFEGWGGACQGTSGYACGVLVTGETEVDVNLLQEVNVSVSVSDLGDAGGSIGGSGIDCPGVCSAWILPPQPVTLYPSPAEGSRFDGWSLACAGTAANASCTLDLTSPDAGTDASIAVGATFARSFDWQIPITVGAPVPGIVQLVDTYSVAADANGNVAAVGYSFTDDGSGVIQPWMALATPAGVLQLVDLFPRTSSYGALIPYAVAFDASGNIVIAGEYAGTYAIGTGTLGPSTDGYDAFVASFAPDGTYQYALTWGGTGTQEIRSLAVAADGSIVIAGGFENAMTFGTVTLTSAGGEDPFVARIDPSHAAVWAQGLGTTTDHERGISVLFGPAGGAYALVNVASVPTVMSFDATGTQAWSASIAGAGIFLEESPDPGGLGLGPTGDVYAGATNENQKIAYLQHFSAAGALVQSVQLSGTVLNDLTVDFAGNVVIGTKDDVEKLDGSFGFLWGTAFVAGDALSNDVYSVTTDGAGNVILGGDSMGPTDFGGGPIPAPTGGSSEGYVVKLYP